MPDAKPPLTAELIWADHLRFGATSGPNAIVIDGDGAAGPSPMQLAAFGLAGCMAADVVAILQKGRHPLTALRVSFSGERARNRLGGLSESRCIFTSPAPSADEAVERAIALSHDTYCSVWHSMRQDIDFATTFEIHP